MRCRKIILVLVFVAAASLCSHSFGRGESNPSRHFPENAKRGILVCLDGEGEANIHFEEKLPVAPLEKDWNRDNQQLPPYEPKKQGPYVRHYSIEFLDEDKRVLYAFPFTYDLTDMEPEAFEIPKGGTIFDSPSYFFHFIGWLPFPEKTKTIVLKHGGKILASKERSRTAPALKLGPPRYLGHEIIEIPWFISDTDSDRVFVDITCTLPGGKATIADDCIIKLRPRFSFAGHAGSYMGGVPTTFHIDAFRFDSTNLSGGDNCRVHVEVSDGMNSVFAEIQPVKMKVRPPGLYVHEPEDGQEIDEGQEITLNGMAFYPSGGSSRDFQLTWISDIDGALGEGERIRVANLSPGHHKITLRADDGKGCTEEESTTIIVNQTGKTSPDFSISEDGVSIVPAHVKPRQEFNVSVSIKAKGIYEKLDYRTNITLFDKAKRLFGSEIHSYVEGDKTKGVFEEVASIPAPSSPGTYRLEVSVSCDRERAQRTKDNKVVKKIVVEVE